ncbi:hypothetical protein HYALB_00010495 [Hymenoscyphus albidus]|uniref:Uncharacterized protein n=1 Tax=Hymenoscyphus albidus TaxID=595503 RepID=A0A9N9LVX4_9HELO|nr:hypothetical protein HYALB_00010495 [Hymenoscyphus albidus]
MAETRLFFTSSATKTGSSLIKRGSLHERLNDVPRPPKYRGRVAPPSRLFPTLNVTRPANSRQQDMRKGYLGRKKTATMTICSIMIWWKRQMQMVRNCAMESIPEEL